MRVPFNTFHDSLLTRLQSLGTAQNTALNQLATGQRVSKASDDPASMGRALELESDKKTEQQFSLNASRATALSQASFDSLKHLYDVNTRVQELAFATNSLSSPVDFQNYATEVDNLLEQSLSTANAKFQGDQLFGGTRTDTPPFVATRNATGQITGVTYQGAAASAGVRVSASEIVTPGTSGAENQSLADFLNGLAGLRTAMQSGSAAAVSAAKPALTTAEDNLLFSVARAGSIQFRLEFNSRQSSANFESLERQLSQEVDIDFAEASVRLNRTQTAYQAAIQSAAKIESQSLLDYLR